MLRWKNPYKNIFLLPIALSVSKENIFRNFFKIVTKLKIVYLEGYTKECLIIFQAFNQLAINHIFSYNSDMRRIIITLLAALLIVPATFTVSDASLVSNRAHRAELRRETKQNTRLIKDLFKVHDKFANAHDLKMLEVLYSDNYINNDGFDKKTYFKSIEQTWETCKDISYTTKILSIEVSGDNASVSVEESATGTIVDNLLDRVPISGEIHSKSKGIYYLTKINGKWYISGENSISDESSLLYGDARFMNIELQAPSQVNAGETYSILLKVDADNETFIVGAIDRDPVTFPSNTPKSELRALGPSKTLERYMKANTDNLNEYAVASMAISKVRKFAPDDIRVYMAGLACVMKRINVIPKNNFVKLED